MPRGPLELVFLPEVHREVVATREALVADVALVAGLRVTLGGREQDISTPRASAEGLAPCESTERGIRVSDVDIKQHRSQKEATGPHAPTIWGCV